MKNLLEGILYIILFVSEYKRQNNKKAKKNENIFQYACLNKTFVLFFIFCTLISAPTANAYCSAVSACKISDIKAELNQNNEVEKSTDDYFLRKIIFYGFKKADYKNFRYDDLFIYRTAV